MATTIDPLTQAHPMADPEGSGAPPATEPGDRPAADEPSRPGKWAAFGGPTTAWGAAASVALLAVVFRSNLEQFVRVWSNDDNYSHGFLVPFISLYFARQAAARGPLAVRGGAWIGSALLLAAILGRLATVVIPVGFIGDLSFLIGLTGLCALFLGRDALRRYWFPLAFLVFMVPLPVALYAKIASPLQLFASQIASNVLNLTGVPVLCEGNLMTLPGNVRMFVAEACSGMRQLTGFLALTAAVAYLAARPAWYRAIIVASAMPIAITANVARVTLTGYIMYFLDPHYAAGTFHTIEGLLMMGFGLALLRGECWILDEFHRLLKADGGPPRVGDTSPSPERPAIA